MQITVLGKVTLVARRGRCVQWISGAGRRLFVAARLRQRGVLKAARARRLRRRRRGAGQPPTRRPLPRPRPVQLRADLCARASSQSPSPAGPGPTPRRGRSCTRRPARARCSGTSSAAGATTSWSRARSRCRSTGRGTSSKPGRSGSASARCPHYTDDVRDRARTDTGGAGSRTARTAAPTTSSSGSPADTDLLLIEATLPRPERTGERGHLTPAEAGEHGRRARRQAAGDHPFLRRARSRVGAGAGGGGVRRPSGARRRGGGL